MHLFKTKQQELLEFCNTKEFISSADIVAWGLDNFYLRSHRTVRDFVQEGKMRKLDKQECYLRGLKGKMAWYEVKEGAICV
jgi:hypothetical protein